MDTLIKKGIVTKRYLIGTELYKCFTYAKGQTYNNSPYIFLFISEWNGEVYYFNFIQRINNIC